MSKHLEEALTALRELDCDEQERVAHLVTIWLSGRCGDEFADL